MPLKAEIYKFTNGIEPTGVNDATVLKVGFYYIC
jgi:hypothetical protein